VKAVTPLIATSILILIVISLISLLMYQTPSLVNTEVSSLSSQYLELSTNNGVHIEFIAHAINGSSHYIYLYNYGWTPAIISNIYINDSLEINDFTIFVDTIENEASTLEPKKISIIKINYTGSMNSITLILNHIIKLRWIINES